MKNVWHPWNSPIEPSRWGDPVCLLNGIIHGVMSWGLFLLLNSVLHGHLVLLP